VWQDGARKLLISTSSIAVDSVGVALGTLEKTKGTVDFIFSEFDLVFVCLSCVSRWFSRRGGKENGSVRMSRTAAANTRGSMPSHQEQCEPATRTNWRRLRSGITLPHRRHFNTNCPPLPPAGWLSTKTGSKAHRDPGALGQDVIKVRACACAALYARGGISVGESWALQNQRYSVGTGRLSILAPSMRFGQLLRG
jgi:hypothetical protein